MKKILSLTIVALMVIGLVAGGTYAFFSDTETSTGNQFAAGTLDLTIDGGNTDSQIFEITADEGYPGMTAVSEYAAMKNIGSVTGKLGIELKNILNFESTGSTEYEKDTVNGAALAETAATGGSTTTIEKTGAGWTASAFVGSVVTVNGESRIITANTTEALTVGVAFSEAVVADDTFTIFGGGELGAKVEVRIWVDLGKDGAFTDGTDYYLISGGTTSKVADDYANAWDALADMAGDYPEIADMIKDADYRVYVDWKIPFGTVVDNTFQGDSVLFDLIFTLEQVA